MFLIIAPHNEKRNYMYVLNHGTTQRREKLNVCSYSWHHTMKRETKFMYLIVAPHNEERN